MLTEHQRQAVGLSAKQLVTWKQGSQSFGLHAETVTPWQQLRQAAKQQGFDLRMVSAHRSFSRQLSIWNDKASGQRPLLTREGERMTQTLSPEDTMYAILRWSAMPGLSRHHWGTDIDVYDANAIDQQDLQLIPQEAAAGGPCAALHGWLQEVIQDNRSFGFYRPYEHDHGAIAPEWWHLSFHPQAWVYETSLSLDVINAVIADVPLALKDQVLDQLHTIWDHYVIVPSANRPSWVTEH